jgi:uncharacterized protein YjiK
MPISHGVADVVAVVAAFERGQNAALVPSEESRSIVRSTRKTSARSWTSLVRGLNMGDEMGVAIKPETANSHRCPR